MSQGHCRAFISSSSERSRRVTSIVSAFNCSCRMKCGHRAPVAADRIRLYFFPWSDSADRGAMRILITGATGFIGGQIAGALIAAGHSLRCAVRDTKRARRMFPRQEMVACNFNRDVTPEAWRARLDGIDAVVNCARHPAIARTAEDVGDPRCGAQGAVRGVRCRRCAARGAYFGARRGARSALSNIRRRKLAAETHLQALDLDWVILRPSMVYSSAGSFGGSSLFRGLAALPLFIPLVGDGGQIFAPIHARRSGAGGAQAARGSSREPAPARGRGAGTSWRCAISWRPCATGWALGRRGSCACRWARSAGWRR